eukprot:gene12353-12487_t
MSWGGVKKIQAVWTAIDNDKGMITGIRLFTPNGKQFCENLGAMSVPPSLRKFDVEHIFQPDEVIVRMVIEVDNVGYIRNIRLDTSQGRGMHIGQSGNRQVERQAQFYEVSVMDLASGVLDGFMFKMRDKSYMGYPTVRCLTAFGPIFLQPYKRMALELEDMPSPPVSLPTSVQSLVLQVTAEDTSWAVVADKFLSSTALLHRLNPQPSSADGESGVSDIRAMVGKSILVCTV